MALSSYTDLLLAIARLTEAYIESTPTTSANSGQANVVDLKLSDSAQYGRSFADDEFTGGTFFADGSGNNPQTIVDFVASTGTLTLGLNLGTTIPAGTKNFLLLSNRYPLTQLRAALASAMADLPPLVYSDETLVTAANTLSYSLNTASRPIGTVLEVWVATRADSPYEYRRAFGVKARPDDAASGLGVVLEFPYQPTAGYKIKVVYTLPANYAAENFLEDPSVDVASAYTLAYAPWLVLEAAVRLVRWRTQQAGADLERLMPLLNDLMSRAARTRMGLGVKRHQPQPVLPWTEVR